MSDLQIVMEEIEALKSAISAEINAAKREGDIPALEKIAKMLGEVMNQL